MGTSLNLKLLGQLRSVFLIDRDERAIVLNAPHRTVS
jgi:hypothetical protein